METINDSNYIVIQGWMLNAFPELTFQELGVYALIYGFCQDNKSEFTGGLQYIADWCRLSRKDVAKRIVDRLVEKGHIIKHEFTFNNTQFVNYLPVLPQNINLHRNTAYE